METTSSDTPSSWSRLLRGTAIALGGGTAALLAYVARQGTGTFSLPALIQLLGFGIMVAGAALVSGGIVGFLFGIPRTSAEDDPEGAPARRYRPNTNLEQISDWLTKILIGVGLVELQEVPELLLSLNAYVSTGFGGPQHASFSGALLVYFAIAGFLLFYLWTRLVVSAAFADADELLLLSRAVEKPLARAEAQTPLTRHAEQLPTEAPKAAQDGAVNRLLLRAENGEFDMTATPKDVALQIARAYFNRRQYAEALPYYERAGAADTTDVHLALQYAKALGEAERRTQAIGFLRSLLKANPGMPEVLKHLGYQLLWSDETDEAVRVNNEYVTLVPSDDAARFNLACAYAQAYGSSTKTRTHYRDLAQAELKRAIAMNRRWCSRARELRDDDFASLSEAEFAEAVSACAQA